MSHPPFHIVFALFPGLTQLDFTGPHQFLTRIPGAKVHVASRAGGEIEAEGGVVFARTERLADIPTVSPEAEALSRALKQRGFTFVGPTIMYAYLQSMGLVDDHLTSCWKRQG